MKTYAPALYTAALLTACSPAADSNHPSGQNAPANTESDGKNITLLNASYDVARDFYKEYNPLFIKTYQSEHPGTSVSIQQSHGGSSKQALSVANGLQADVVTMNQSSDIDLLEKKGLVEKGWQQALPDHAAPYTSTMVFLVRKNNPKQIRDWNDLAKDGVNIVIANPKTSGNGRYAFLGAYGYGLKTTNGNEQEAQKLVASILKNTPVFENGGRAATTTFTQRNIGDVLITFENEANYVSKKLTQGQFEIVYPSYTISAESPVAVVNSVVAKKGTQKNRPRLSRIPLERTGARTRRLTLPAPPQPRSIGKTQSRLPRLRHLLSRKKIRRMGQHHENLLRRRRHIRPPDRTKMTAMPSEPPFRRHFTHQNRKTAPKIIITKHNGKPDTKPNTAAKMPSEAVGATILIWGPLQGRITFLNHPFDSQINSAFACQKQNQYFAVRIGTFIVD